MEEEGGDWRDVGGWDIVCRVGNNMTWYSEWHYTHNAPTICLSLPLPGVSGVVHFDHKAILSPAKPTRLQELHAAALCFHVVRWKGVGIRTHSTKAL